MSAPAGLALRSALDELKRLLELEQQALMSGQTERLPGIAAAKQQALPGLAALHRLPPGALTPEIRQQIRELQRRNALNGKLLAPRLSITRRAISVLGADRSTYTQDAGTRLGGRVRRVDATA